MIVVLQYSPNPCYVQVVLTTASLRKQLQIKPAKGEWTMPGSVCCSYETCRIGHARRHIRSRNGVIGVYSTMVLEHMANMARDACEAVERDNGWAED